MEFGVQAIFGPSDPILGAHIQSICEGEFSKISNAFVCLVLYSRLVWQTQVMLYLFTYILLSLRSLI